MGKHFTNLYPLQNQIYNQNNHHEKYQFGISQSKLGANRENNLRMMFMTKYI